MKKLIRNLFKTKITSKIHWRCVNCQSSGYLHPNEYFQSCQCNNIPPPQYGVLSNSTRVKLNFQKDHYDCLDGAWKTGYEAVNGKFYCKSSGVQHVDGVHIVPISKEQYDNFHKNRLYSWQ